MHKDTVYGEVNLRFVKSFPLCEAMKRPNRILDTELKEKIKAMIKLGYTEKQIKAYFKENKEVWSDINLKKIDMYYFTNETSDRFFATRKTINTSYDKKKIKGSITDTAIQKIMLNHLAKYNGKADLAFSPDGIDDMNSNIKELNDGKEHQPIYKVRWYENAEKFAVGQKGNKKTKFVEAAKGSHLFFVVYENDVLNDNGEMVKERSFRTISLNEALNKMKDGILLDEKAKFILSPNDLVYLPKEEELKDGKIHLPLDKKRIYKAVDFDKTTINFVYHSSANVLFSVSKDESHHYSGIQNEYGKGSPQSKNQKSITGEMIKEICIPIKVDRLGHIIKIGV